MKKVCIIGFLFLGQLFIGSLFADEWMQDRAHMLAYKVEKKVDNLISEVDGVDIIFEDSSEGRAAEDRANAARKKVIWSAKKIKLQLGSYHRVIDSMLFPNNRGKKRLNKIDSEIEKIVNRIERDMGIGTPPSLDELRAAMIKLRAEHKKIFRGWL